MYGTFLVSEWKKWRRDPLMTFMLFYPLMFGIIGRYLLPWIARLSEFRIELFSDLIIAFLTVMTPHLFGSLAAFSILDDRDDHILTSVRVTPLTINQFLSFRLAMIWVLSFATSVFVILFTGIGDISVQNALVISFLISFGAPFTAFLINTLAQNKIEGFAIMKTTGIIIFFPLVGLFFTDAKELIFSVAPAFWPAKVISTLIRGEAAMLLTFNQYFFIGLAYILLLNILVYRLFLRRTKV